jgi:mono/diheme cytochrome c family protein
MSETNNQSQNSKLIGLLAQFDDPDSLVHACDQARQDGYQAMDAYSPFPVHGIDPALGIKRTILPFIVLAIALGGCFVGVGMQYYTNAVDWSPLFPGYAFKISGKPYFSLPANIPVAFEVIVLSSAFATFLGMWFLNKLPMLANPLHRVSRFKRATNDKFFLMIETRDPKFDRSQTESQLNEWGAVSIDECRQDLTDTKLPNFLKLAGILGAILLLLPPVMVFRAMGMTNRQPRLHFMPDMDWQDKYKAQVLSPDLGNDDLLFANLHAARAPVMGSVAWGQLDTDTEYFMGVKKDWTPKVATIDSTAGSFTSTAETQETEAPVAEEEDLTKYVTTFPDGFEINEETLARGQDRFNIYCVVCHGYAGNGDGLVNQRAVALASSGKAAWTTAKSLHEPELSDPEKNPIGRIFDTITNGRNTMGPYRDQIPPEDRWAIVAYVKALQETGIKAPSVIAAEAEAAAKDSTEGDSTGPQP